MSIFYKQSRCQRDTSGSAKNLQKRRKIDTSQQSSANSSTFYLSSSPENPSLIVECSQHGPCTSTFYVNLKPEARASNEAGTGSVEKTEISAAAGGINCGSREVSARRASQKQTNWAADRDFEDSEMSVDRSGTGDQLPGVDSADVKRDPKLTQERIVPRVDSYPEHLNPFRDSEGNSGASGFKETIMKHSEGSVVSTDAAAAKLVYTVHEEEKKLFSVGVGDETHISEFVVTQRMRSEPHTPERKVPAAGPQRSSSAGTNPTVRKSRKKRPAPQPPVLCQKPGVSPTRDAPLELPEPLSLASTEEATQLLGACQPTAETLHQPSQVLAVASGSLQPSCVQEPEEPLESKPGLSGQQLGSKQNLSAAGSDEVCETLPGVDSSDVSHSSPVVTDKEEELKECAVRSDIRGQEIEFSHHADLRTSDMMSPGPSEEMCSIPAVHAWTPNISSSISVVLGEEMETVLSNCTLNIQEISISPVVKDKGESEYDERFTNTCDEDTGSPLNMLAADTVEVQDLIRSLGDLRHGLDSCQSDMMIRESSGGLEPGLDGSQSDMVTRESSGDLKPGLDGCQSDMVMRGSLGDLRPGLDGCKSDMATRGSSVVRENVTEEAVNSDDVASQLSVWVPEAEDPEERVIAWVNQLSC